MPKFYRVPAQAGTQSRGRNQAPAWCGLGILREGEGKTKEALSCLQKAVDACPADADAHHHLALLLESAGRDEEALVHLQAAIENVAAHGIASLEYIQDEIQVILGAIVAEQIADVGVGLR